MQDPNVEALLAYLRQNSGRFSLESLELQMHAAGHTPATVQAALDRFLAAARPHAAPAGDESRGGTVAIPVLALAPKAGGGPEPAIPPPPGTPVAAARSPVWPAAFAVAAFDLVLAGAGFGLVKGGEGKAAWMGGCILVLVPLGLLLELLIGLVLTATDGASRSGRALLYGSLLVIGLAALILAGIGVYFAARS